MAHELTLKENVAFASGVFEVRMVVPSMKIRAFTLIEILIVIAIIAVLAALLFPVFARAKDAAKKNSCLSNIRQVGMATNLYLVDYDGMYPQTRKTSPLPEVEDIAGWIDEPFFGSAYRLIAPYTGTKVQSTDLSAQKLYACPIDPDPFGQKCFAINPDSPDLTSFVRNGFFVFGLSESAVASPSRVILDAERRSAPVAAATEFCDDVYHPWFTADNPFAPEVDMDPLSGAVATLRHNSTANYLFAEGHTQNLKWSQTFAPPTVNLHTIREP